MQDTPIVILCTGDIHLGRHPTRIPEDVDGLQYSPRAIWKAIVERAIEEDVDAVVVTGDVIDRKNRYYEAYGPFEAGCRRLNDAGIPVILVAGNHDYDTLSSIVAGSDLGNLHILGAKGNWERFTLERDGHPVVCFDGWSFPAEHVPESPVKGYDLPEATGTPIIGVVHADLDSAMSVYAPVAKSELLNAPAHVWILGHIHKPAVYDSTTPLIVNPGSPQPLDPGEVGPHGPWLVTIKPTGAEAIQIPMATIRYACLDIDVSSITDPWAIPSLIKTEFHEDAALSKDTNLPELVLLRVVLAGRSAVHGQLQDPDVQSRIREELVLELGGTQIRIEDLNIETRPELDLEDLAQGMTPAAWLAGLLLLEDDQIRKEHARLVEDSMLIMRTAYRSSAYRPVRQEDWVSNPDQDAAIRAIRAIRREAWNVLDVLTRQKEGARE